MRSPESIVHHVDAALRADPARVVARPFLPGEELPLGRSRSGGVVARVLALPEDEVERIAAQLVTDFGSRHREFVTMLGGHADMVRSRLGRAPAMSAARTLVVGASFTAEFAIEGAALCNPSAVRHPDQDGLAPGGLRVAVSLRGIGEGHLSSIGFAEAIIGPDGGWAFGPRVLPAVAGSSTAARWNREHLRAVLADQGRIDHLAYNLLAELPEEFDGDALQHALATVHRDLLGRVGGAATVTLFRRLMASTYRVAFPPDVALSQRVLLPSSDEESNGMEDARFVRFTADDGTVDYRATYTAYDGSHIAPRSLTSPDLRVFRAHRLAGPAAQNKGMALFPRMVHGRHLSLCRSDGESSFIASSDDGYVWGDAELLQGPQQSWEVLQVGNCGSPIETARGWLVLTHGAGPMRTYAIGALLLDLEDPRRVLAALERPLLRASLQDRDGYVPNVVYSCGGIVHDGRLWVPYGVGDTHIEVAWAWVDELFGAMTPVAGGAAR